jgi:hypothetical protein
MHGACCARGMALRSLSRSLSRASLACVAHQLSEPGISRPSAARSRTGPSPMPSLAPGARCALPTAPWHPISPRCCAMRGRRAALAERWRGIPVPRRPGVPALAHSGSAQPSPSTHSHEGHSHSHDCCGGHGHPDSHARAYEDAAHSHAHLHTDSHGHSHGHGHGHVHHEHDHYPDSWATRLMARLGLVDLAERLEHSGRSAGAPERRAPRPPLQPASATSIFAASRG